MNNPKATIVGVNTPNASRNYTITPSAPENSQTRQILFVDINGKPLIVREARKMGFRIQ